jgi:hypothetical protein
MTFLNELGFIIISRVSFKSFHVRGMPWPHINDPIILLRAERSQSFRQFIDIVIRKDEGKLVKFDVWMRFPSR